MSFSDILDTAQRASGLVQGISNTTQGGVDLLARITGGSFRAQLRAASYRGVSFGVLGGTARFGRRNAVHEYPFRDTPWIEDIGRSARRILLSGFLVGDDVIAQRDRLIAACEKAGDGELIHPTLGRRLVALMDVSTTEHWDQGRVFEISFSFVEQGQRLYPQTSTSTTANVLNAAKASDAASLSAFVSKAAGYLKAGAAAANEAAATATQWVRAAVQTGNDATSLFKLAVSLPGQFGRLLGLASGVNVGQTVPSTAGLTLQDLTGKAAFDRQGISAASATLNASGASLSASTVSSFGAATQAVTASVLAAVPTPGDGIRGLAVLASFVGTTQALDAALSMHLVCNDLFRRAAVAAMARSASSYAPVSGDDAANVRVTVLAYIDAQITTAGDAGDDDVYAALRAMRATVVQDLNAKGAGLPTLRTFSAPLPLPSLVIAQRLYRDPTREAELVARANPMHPAFMPRSFQVLNA